MKTKGLQTEINNLEEFQDLKSKLFDIEYRVNMEKLMQVGKGLE